ncbi:hypothetical protein, partial [Nannocystis sp.]|uniref:hypothetical protein n=1 Tax=Nannocystis sp. TaxID=1962667 RepID=UPI0025D207D9
MDATDLTAPETALIAAADPARDRPAGGHSPPPMSPRGVSSGTRSSRFVTVFAVGGAGREATDQPRTP